MLPVNINTVFFRDVMYNRVEIYQHSGGICYLIRYQKKMALPSFKLPETSGRKFQTEDGTKSFFLNVSVCHVTEYPRRFNIYDDLL